MPGNARERKWWIWNTYILSIGWILKLGYISCSTGCQLFPCSVAIYPSPSSLVTNVTSDGAGTDLVVFRFRKSYARLQSTFYLEERRLISRIYFAVLVNTVWKEGVLVNGREWLYFGGAIRWRQLTHLTLQHYYTCGIIVLIHVGTCVIIPNSYLSNQILLRILISKGDCHEASCPLQYRYCSKFIQIIAWRRYCQDSLNSFFPASKLLHVACTTPTRSRRRHSVLHLVNLIPVPSTTKRTASIIYNFFSPPPQSGHSVDNCSDSFAQAQHTQHW